jgi:crotonobetainyl-CoA:carnitine CoA-transferase CaiB-like acyl-CoA transferase
MPGHDINFQAMAGTMGYSSRPEVPLLQLGDLASGMYAALGILAALVKRKTAVFIDVPIVPSLASWMIIPASAYLATGQPPKKGHSLVFGSTPYYNLYRTADGKYVAVAAIEDRFWRNLLNCIGAPELEHQRFGTLEERRALASRLKSIFATKSRDEWAKLLMHKDTCATPVLTVEEALTSQWAKTTSLLAKAQGETVINSPLITRPKARSASFTKAPGLGDDTEAIMKALGYSRRQVEDLRSKGVIE